MGVVAETGRALHDSGDPAIEERSLALPGCPPRRASDRQARNDGTRAGLNLALCIWPRRGACAISFRTKRVKTKCLSSIFLRAKLTASWCTTVQVWAERLPTCSGSTTTRGKIKKGKWFRWRQRRTVRYFSTFCHWIWE